jgi:hypothetical protein
LIFSALNLTSTLLSRPPSLVNWRDLTRNRRVMPHLTLVVINVKRHYTDGETFLKSLAETIISLTVKTFRCMIAA